MIAAGLHQGNLSALPYRVNQCDNCGGDFVRVVPWQKFCCKSCRNDFHYYDNREDRKAYQRDYRAYIKSVQPVKLSKADLVKALNEERERNAILEEQNQKLQEKVDRLTDNLNDLTKTVEQMMSLMKSGTAFATQAQSTEAPQRREMPAPKADYALPELEIKAAVVDGKASVANFMNSLNGIATSYHQQAPVKIDVVESERTPGGLKKLQGGDVALSVPDFDDLEL